MNKLRGMLALVSFMVVLASIGTLLLLMVKMPEEADNEGQNNLPNEEVRQIIQWDEPITEKPFRSLHYEDKALGEEITKETIKDNFEPKFEELEKQVSLQVDQLIQDAVTDYQEQIQSGKEGSLIQLYQKYTKAAQELEDKTDEAFLQIYNEYQDELKANGFNSSEADGMKVQYEETKETIRSNLLREVASRN
ncbi:hypothetical protein GCM10007216_12260 [Thalassobacillus devorans]|uniref:Uncharacterized protein n=1 Tax=Thalassobacillus devorans TaxID=279813 RepID=A0ABQ1NQW6_9BACI|nr:hypothetical protein [Thalassobacillus devorans]NIK28833.1 hypothetical protein [Thalassobacillus devorans]GGC83208.1 hypothetical protein GCM10007216_12260 [Thalassobacillus devorans]